ncbi:hypothetical protein BGZ68_003090 [Mortierella alpina]|nr:hypothetical protein BGZ68_003090 [Mortierella alpina]
MSPWITARRVLSTSVAEAVHIRVPPSSSAPSQISRSAAPMTFRSYASLSNPHVQPFTAHCHPTRSAALAPFASQTTSSLSRDAITRRMLPMVSGFHSSASIHRAQSSKTATETAALNKPETRACWKCGTAVPFLAFQCTNADCKVVQTLAPGANYFEILGLGSEPTFDIDLKDLRIKFFKIQQQIHPDSYSQNTNGDQVYAQQQSSLTNKAYATLKEPLSRANYILELLGAPIHETESLDETELLMEVMEARELLEDAQTEEEVDDLKHVNDARIKDAVSGLSKAFKDQDMQQAKTLAIQLQYWIRINNVIRDWAAGKTIVADHV